MKTQLSKLDNAIENVETCNNYFSNHVGKHSKDNVRKAIIFLQLVIILTIILI